MKLHSSAIDKLLTLFQNYGGTSPDDVKLKNMIASMEFTPYERKLTSDQEVVLVLTEDYVKALTNKRQ
jgi:hypothetical protein